MKNTLVKQLNDQINLEMASAYLYYDMSVVMSAANYNGFASWLRKQCDEELEHAEKIVEFLLARGETPKLRTVELESLEETTPLAFAKASLEHEQLVSESIRKIRKNAVEEGDQEVEVFLNWFITEQVEEEDSAQKNVDLFTLAGDNVGAIFQVDALLANR